MPLRDFQVVGSAFLQAHPRALLGDDAGLGKSLEVLSAVDSLGAQRVLCLAPAAGAVSWPGQIKLWSPSRTFVDLDLGTNFGFELPGFYFVSFDTLSRKDRASLVADLTTCKPWDVLVIDEAHRLKNSGARRTIATYGADFGDGKDTGIAGNARVVWPLSGTFAPNHAGEVYTHLRALFPDILRALGAAEEHEFQDKFCRVRDTVYGRVIEGSKNQRELKAALSSVLLRRRKSEVLTELPGLEWFTAPLTLDPGVVHAIYSALVADVGVDVDTTTGTDDDDHLIAMLNATSPHASALRRSLGLAKVPSCIEWINDRLSAGEPKIVVFAHHTDVINALREGLLDREPVVFRGDTSTARRAKAVTTFQEDPNCRVFLGQLHACGEVITLTEAKTVFFAEYAGTPGVNYQAASRAHRMGQRDGVQAYFGTVPGTLDERIAATAARRAREIAEIFD
jgi:SWI/SNF-related matrix-associated actin-dependent regulator 1 of chromatin subfamily A